MSGYKKILAAKKKKAQLLAGGGLVQKFDYGGPVMALPGNPISNPLGNMATIPAGGGMTDGWAGSGVSGGWDWLAAKDPMQKAQIQSLPDFAKAPMGIANPYDQTNPTIAAMQQQGVHADMSGANAANSSQLGMGSQAFKSGQDAMNDAMGTAGLMTKYGNNLVSAGQGAMGQQLDAAGQLNGVFTGQQNLANQLQNQAMGNGPGQQLAQNMLHQATQNNISMGAGQIAGARGINPAMAARMIGENTANLNQQAAMQGTNLGLQSQMNAQQQLGNVYGQMGNTAGTQAGIYGNAASMGLGTGSNFIGNAGSLQGQAANIGMNSGTSLANSGAGQAGTNAYNSANINLGSQGQQLGAIGQYNDTLTKGQLGAQQQDVDIAKANMQAKNNLAGGVLNAAGGIGAAAMAASHGMTVPGSANFSGDDPRNDTVDAKLSPGEIVIPRSITEHEHAPYLAAEFVRNALMGKGPKPKYEDGKRRAYDGALPIGEDDEEESPMITNSDEASPQPAGGTGALPAWMSGKSIPTFGELVGPNDVAKQAMRAKQMGPPKDMAGPMPSSKRRGSGIEYNPNISGVPADVQKASAAAPGPDLYKGAWDNINAGLDQMEGAAKGFGAAGQAQAAGQDKAWDQYGQNMKAAQDNYNKSLASLNDENTQLTQAVMTSKIDPQRLWANADTGNKIGAAIGILLSGIGSGLSGQPNMAMGVINKMIDQDIDAQKSELGKKQTLLSMNLAKYGRLDQAYQVTSSQLHAVVEGQLGQAAARGGGMEAGARAQQALGQLQMQRGGMQQQAAAAQAYNGSAGQPSGGGVNLDRIRLGMQAGLIPKEVGAAALKEAGEYTMLENQLAATSKAFDDVAKDQDAARRFGSPLQSTAQIKAATKIYGDMIAKEASGRVNQSSLDAAVENFPTYTDDANTIAMKKANLTNLLKSKAGGGFPHLRAIHSLDPNDPLLQLSGTTLTGETPTGRP